MTTGGLGPGDPAGDRSRRQANAASFLPPVVLLAGKEVADPAAEPGDANDRHRGALAEVVQPEWQRRWAVEESVGRWQRSFRADQPAFRSTILYCEMKFNQALELCRELGPGSPSTFLTLAASECLQLLLSTLAEPALPLARVLCAEVYRSIYSDYDAITAAPRDVATVAGRPAGLVRPPTVAHAPFFDELRRAQALLAKAEARCAHFDALADRETAALLRRSRQLDELMEGLGEFAAAPLLAAALQQPPSAAAAPAESAAAAAPAAMDEGEAGDATSASAELRGLLSALLSELRAGNEEVGAAIALFLARPVEQSLEAIALLVSARGCPGRALAAQLLSLPR